MLNSLSYLLAWKLRFTYSVNKKGCLKLHITYSNQSFFDRKSDNTHRATWEIWQFIKFKKRSIQRIWSNLTEQGFQQQQWLCKRFMYNALTWPWGTHRFLWWEQATYYFSIAHEFILPRIANALKCAIRVIGKTKTSIKITPVLFSLDLIACKYASP